MSDQTILIVLEWIIAIYLGLAITLRFLKAYRRLFDTTPPGQAKEWIFALPAGYGFAVSFTNQDGKNGKWTYGVFKISRKK